MPQSHQSHMSSHIKEEEAAAAAASIVETRHTQSETNHAFLGGMAGMLVSTILHPLEVIKIGIIINPMKLQSIESANFLRSFQLVGQYIKNTEGYLGFFRGLTPEILRSCVGTSMYFQILKELEWVLQKQLGACKDNSLCQFTASATARMASAYLTNPLGVIASRCQVPGFSVYKNMFDGAMKIYKYEGLASFMKGSLASAMKEGPFAGTYYMIYRLLKKNLEQFEGQTHYCFTSLFSGMIAGFVATSVSHPFEIIRARQQIISQFDVNSDYKYNNGIIDALKKIYQIDGPAGYFRGLAPRLVRKPLANSLTFTLFEIFHNFTSETKW